MKSRKTLPNFSFHTVAFLPPFCFFCFFFVIFVIIFFKQVLKKKKFQNFPHVTNDKLHLGFFFKLINFFLIFL